MLDKSGLQLVELITCNIYAVQQDTQSVSMSEFCSALMLARHVSDLIGPSSEAFYKLYLQIWYVLRLDVSSSTRRAKNKC